MTNVNHSYMLKKGILLASLLFLSITSYTQSSHLSELLTEIENNNKELISYSSLKESKQMALKSTNTLPNLETGAYYLPFGNHDGGSYKEFEVSQSFDLPVVYKTRKGIINREEQKMDLEYRLQKQEILLPAKKVALEIIYLNKKIAIEQERLNQAKKVYDHIQELYKTEQVGILDINKSKVIWIKEQFKTQEYQLERDNLLVVLKNLNGGVPITFSQSNFNDSTLLAPLENIWTEKQSSSPTLLLSKQKEEIALQHITLSKNNNLPSITTGLNIQTTPQETYSGVYGGLSIPLWSNKTKTQAAQANYDYQQSKTEVETINLRTEFEREYNEYVLLQKKYTDYKEVIGTLNSDQLLLEAYELGAISFMEYYLELQFYRDAYDSRVKMEFDLQILKSDLLKHEF